MVCRTEEVRGLGDLIHGQWPLPIPDHPHPFDCAQGRL